MGANTAIEWCDHSANPWWGCIKVSNGPDGACPNCYASDLSHRWGHDFENRRRPIKAFWSDLPKWDKQAEVTGVRPRVFIMSMGDIWERLPPGHVDYDFLEDARRRALELIEACIHLDVLLLTKRISNVRKLAPVHWLTGGWPAHVRQGISVVTQAEADRDIPRLLELPCTNFLSMEPLRGLVSIAEFLPTERVVGIGSAYGSRTVLHRKGIGWCIAGGESGPHARPAHPDWFRKLRDQCVAADVPYHYKQTGEWQPIDQPWKQNSPKSLAANEQWINAAGGQGFHGEEVWRVRRVGKKAAGHLLDGVAWQQFPHEARV